MPTKQRLPILVLLALLAAPAAAMESWTTLQSQSNPPTPRHEAGYVELNGRFYLMGGRGNKPVECYDPVTDQWTTLGDPVTEIHHFQPVSYGGLIYVVGAMTGGFPGELPLADIYIYDPEPHRWILGPAVSRPRGGGGAAVYDDLIYLAGGQLVGHTSDTMGWLDAFDPMTGQWTQLSSMDHPRDHVAIVANQGKLWVAGGRVSDFPNVFDNTVAEVDVYDIASGQWSTQTQVLPTPRAGAFVAVLGDQLLVMGGESPVTSDAHDETEAMNLLTGDWSTLSPMNDGRHGTGAAPFAGQLYVASGSGGRGGGPELSSQECFSLDGGCVVPPTLPSTSLVATQPSLDFGFVDTRYDRTLAVTVTNDADAGGPSLDVFRVMVVGADAAAFSATFTPSTLAPGESSEVLVTFAPDQEREYGVGQGLSSAVLSVEYTQGRSALTVPLTGTGTQPTAAPPGAAAMIAHLRAEPNPFNPRTAVVFSLRRESPVEVIVRSVRGERIVTLHEGVLGHGDHRVTWEGRDDRGRSVASGVYFVEVLAAGERRSLKISLAK